MTSSRPHTHSAPLVDPVALRALVDRRSRDLSLTRDQLAQAARIGRSTLFDWLNGTGQPPAAGWWSLADALRLPLAEMFAELGCPPVSTVEQRRLDRGWTRGDLAKAAEVSFATVRALEAGRAVRPDAAGRVAAALGLDEPFLTGAARVTAKATTPLGRALEAERLRRGWNIADVARELGTARQLVSAWMLGNEPVAARWLPRLADLLGADVAHVRALADSSRRAKPGAAAGETIRLTRKAAGLSQAALAYTVGVSATTVEQWESGRRLPGAQSRAALSDALGVPADALRG